MDMPSEILDGVLLNYIDSYRGVCYKQNGPGILVSAGFNRPKFGGLRGNPVRIRDRPAAVSGDESRTLGRVIS